MNYFVYMLRCADGSFYVGVTNDVDYRAGQHNTGWDPTSYTHSRRPCELVYTTDFQHIEDAIAWEKSSSPFDRLRVTEEWGKNSDMGGATSVAGMFPWLSTSSSLYNALEDEWNACSSTSDCTGGVSFTQVTPSSVSVPANTAIFLVTNKPSNY